MFTGKQALWVVVIGAVLVLLSLSLASHVPPECVVGSVPDEFGCRVVSALGTWISAFSAFVEAYEKVIITMGTIVVAAFTGTLWWSTRKLWLAGERQATAIQRAFVSIKSIEATVVGADIHVMPQWENGGSTPTKNMINYVNWKFFGSGELTDDYGFPDLDVSGRPLSKPGNATQLFIGPRATLYGERLRIPVQLVEQLRNGTGRLLIWGWTRYDDVFQDTPRHVTKFCNEMVVLDAQPVALESGAQGIEAKISFALYGRHNCADGECD